jgi:hypothetical protein
LSYLARLASIATEVYAVMEVNTVFPGKVKDFFDNSETMRSYFTRVQAAETRIFGGVGFTPGNVKVLPVKSGVKRPRFFAAPMRVEGRVVGVLELGWWDVAKTRVKSTVVVPIDPAGPSSSSKCNTSGDCSLRA